MPRLLLTLASAFLAIAMLGVGCAEVAPSGTGGNGGSGGSSGPGGSAGTGATGGGTAGTGGAPSGILPQPVLTAVPELPENAPFAAEPPVDSVDVGAGVALGEVAGSCFQGECFGTDPADQWSIQPTETGEHAISLNWASTNVDLDLFLADMNGSPLAGSVEEGNTPELLLFTLTAGQLYIIQVQAFDTLGLVQAYTLEVTGP